MRRSPATDTTTTDRPGADPSTDEVAMAARLRLSATRLARRLRQQSDSGLTPTQLSALAAVDRHGPPAMISGSSPGQRGILTGVQRSNQESICSDGGGGDPREVTWRDRK